jgi:hypothetical protein
MQSFLAKTLAERTVASTEGDTHEVLRSVLVDQFYGASLIIHTLPNVGVKMNAFATRHRASGRRQVESARRASAGCRCAPSDARRGWGRKHQFVAFPSTSTSRRGPFFLNSTHCTTAQLDSGAHSPHKAWPLRTRHLANPNQELGFFFIAAPDIIFLSINWAIIIRLGFYGTQLTISATRMVARRFSLLPSHASRVDRMLNRLAIMPQCPQAIPGCQVF